MSFLNLGKKLSPAGRAWKGFACSLQTNLRRLSNSKTVKHTKKRLNTILGRSTKSPSEPRRTRRERSTVPGSHRHALFHRGFKPVYVDQLFASGSTTVAVSVLQAMERGGEKVKDCASAWESSSVPAMPWEVDKRAEKFIAKFRREMSLQRERSLDEYQEMLARSAN